MTATVITICTNRKRSGVTQRVAAADLPKGSAEAVAREWINRVTAAPRMGKARELYGGRSFRDAEAASRHLGVELRIVSAGLGLIGADTLTPVYGLTLLPRHADGVLAKIDGRPADWWRALTQISPFHSDAYSADGPILAALSAPYLDMVADAWCAWPKAQRDRLRIFAKARPEGVAAPLASAWMPYDDRLDGAGPSRQGTQGDFAQRALRHYVETFGEGTGDARADAAQVADALLGLKARSVPYRKRMDDAELLELIAAEWDAAGGRSSAMLRRLRDDLGVACEQSRLKALFQTVARARAMRTGDEAVR